MVRVSFVRRLAEDVVASGSLPSLIDGFPNRMAFWTWSYGEGKWSRVGCLFCRQPLTWHLGVLPVIGS